ncbi:hypothetical protein ACOMHN_061087 [Nucella lapillus]
MKLNLPTSQAHFDENSRGTSYPILQPAPGTVFGGGEVAFISQGRFILKTEICGHKLDSIQVRLPDMADLLKKGRPEVRPRNSAADTGAGTPEPDAPDYQTASDSANDYKPLILACAEY